MTQTYLRFFFEDDVGVWNFEFWSLEFVCYLGFVICNFLQLLPLYIKNEGELYSQQHREAKEDPDHKQEVQFRDE